MKGKVFLFSILNPLIASIANNGSFEIDPDKTAPGKLLKQYHHRFELTRNPRWRHSYQCVEVECSDHRFLFKTVLARWSTPSVRIKLNLGSHNSSVFILIYKTNREIRRLGALIRRVVWKVSPDNPKLERLVVGNLFFLRFLCPMLATTQTGNTFSIATNSATLCLTFFSFYKKDQYGHPLTRDTRRACVLVSKLLQNLVAGVEFDGSKETYMCCLNVFILGQQDNINTFIRRFTVRYSPQIRLWSYIWLFIISQDELTIPPLSPMDKITPEQRAVIESTLFEAIHRNQDRLWEALLTPERLHLFRRMKFFAFYGFNQAASKVLS